MPPRARAERRPPSAVAEYRFNGFFRGPSGTWVVMVTRGYCMAGAPWIWQRRASSRATARWRGEKREWGGAVTAKRSASRKGNGGPADFPHREAYGLGSGWPGTRRSCGWRRKKKSRRRRS